MYVLYLTIPVLLNIQEGRLNVIREGYTVSVSKYTNLLLSVSAFMFF